MEVDILIQAKDMASRVFDQVESAAADTFETIETDANGASSAVDGFAAAAKRAQQEWEAQEAQAAQVGQEWADSYGQSAEQLDQALEQADQALKDTQENMEQTASKAEESSDRFQISWTKVGVALGAAGGGLELLARKSAETNTEVDRLAVTTGLTADAIRNLAIESASSADDVSEFVDLFALAAKNGARTQEELASFAGFWDTVSDAIGIGADQLASYAPALRAVGIGLGKEGEALNALSYAQTQTTIGADGLLSVLTRMAPELKQLGLSIDDTAAVMGFLESKGITGRAAMREFSSAANESKGNQKDFYKALGMSKDQLEEYRKKVISASGAIEQMAENEATHHTLIERLTNTIKEYTMENSVLLESLGQLSPVLIGVGAAIAGLASAWPVLIAIFPALGTAATAAGTAVSAALGPIALVIAGVVAAGALLYVAWTRDWGGIQEKTAIVIEYLQAGFNALVSGATVAFNTLREVFTPVFETLKSVISSFVPILQEDLGGAFNTVKDDVTTALAVLSAAFHETFDPLLPYVEPILNGIKDLVAIVAPYLGEIWRTELAIAYTIISTALSGIYNVVKTILTSVWATFKWLGDMISNTMAVIVGILTGNQALFEQGGRGLIDAFVRGIKAMANAPLDAVRWIMGKVRALLPGSDAEEGPLSDITASGMGFMYTFAKGLTAGGPEVEQAVIDTWERVNKIVDNLSGQTAKRLTSREVEEEKKRAASLATQREWDNKARLQQVEEQAAAEIALARKYGQDTTEIEKYWNRQIREEQERIAQEELQAEKEKRDQKIKFYEDTQSAYEEILERKRQADQEEYDNWVSIQEARASVAGGFSELMTMLYEQSGESAKGFFVLAKTAAIAEAIINAHLAATKALAEIPPPYNVAMAAIIYGKAMMEVAAITAQTIKMAKGGVVTRPTNALIGEAGPEAVIPLDRFNMGMGRPIYITVEIIGGIWTASPETGQELARYIRPYLNQEYAR